MSTLDQSKKASLEGTLKTLIVEKPLTVHNSAVRAAAFCSASELQLGKREIVFFPVAEDWSVMQNSAKWVVCKKPHFQ